MTVLMSEKLCIWVFKNFLCWRNTSTVFEKTWTHLSRFFASILLQSLKNLHKNVKLDPKNSVTNFLSKNIFDTIFDKCTFWFSLLKKSFTNFPRKIAHFVKILFKICCQTKKNSEATTSQILEDLFNLLQNFAASSLVCHKNEFFCIYLLHIT